jgi:hypothetical protein
VTGALAANTDALRGFIRNADQWSQTTDAVLGNGGAEQFAAGLARLDSLANHVNTTFATLIPQSRAFQNLKLVNGKTPQEAAIDLIYQIGDAASQGDAYGQWLRQYDNGGDTSGLTPGQPKGTNSNSAVKPGSGTTVPPLPLPFPNPLPPLPGLPPVGGSNGSSSGGGSAVPTPPSLINPGGINLLSYGDMWLADYGAWGNA